MNKTLTESEAKTTPLPCGYSPNVVVSLTVRVSNVLYNELKQETENTGYGSIAEFLRQATIEKLQRDKEARIEYELKQRQAAGM